MLNAIFFLTMYPVLFILFYIYKNEGKVKRHTLFGIRISEDWLSKEESEAMQAEFQGKMKRYLLVLAIVPFVTFLIPYFSISLTIWMIWLRAAIIVFMMPYALGNRRLLQLKQERVVAKDTENVIYAEIKNAGFIRTVKKADFLIPNLLSIGIVIFALISLRGERFELYNILIIMFAACTPVFYGCALWVDRMKAKVISTDSDVNVNYARASKKLWKDFWGACMWINTVFTAVILLTVLLVTSRDSVAIYMILWGCILYSLLILGLSGYLYKKKKQLDEQYADKMDISAEEDERAWIGGILYYNPKDSHTMVSNKLGMGTTVNLATPVGKVTAVVAVLSLLIIPISCVWVMLEEFTPISLTVTDNMLVAGHWKTEYEISLDDIEEVTLVEELPRSSKVNGSGMDNLEKGTYRNSEDGKYKCLLNPKNGAFLKFTANDTIYYMSGYDDAETMQVYERVR